MRYQVPQFIEVEDKIFGPLTFKQFVYLAGGGGVALIFFSLLPFYLAILFTLPFAALSLGLAFYRVNDRPLVVMLEHAFKYYTHSKLYLWKQQPPKAAPTAPAATPASSQLTMPSLSENRLKDLSWSLNIKDRSKMGVVDTERPGFEI